MSTTKTEEGFSGRDTTGADRLCRMFLRADVACLIRVKLHGLCLETAVPYFAVRARR